MTSAKRFEILTRQRPSEVGPTTLSDFGLGPQEEVSADILVKDATWSLYGLDLAAGQAIFVRLPPGADLSTAPFMSILQYNAACEALTLPISALPALSLALPAPERMLFLFSMGRCGTTLVSNIFAQSPDVFSLSEPESFLTLALARNSVPVADQTALIAAMTRFAYRPPAGRPAGILALKFHSQVLFQAEHFHASFPQARYLFQYRDARSWANSFYHFLQNIGFDGPIDAERFAFVWNILTADTPQDWCAPFVDASAALFRPEDLLAPAWLRHVEEYRRLLSIGLPFKALRYNELNSDRAASTASLLTWAGLPASALDRAMQAFDHDSQEGTFLARSREVRSFGPENYAYLLNKLALGPAGLTPDMFLPDAPA